jgi:hypothetical protein
MTTQVRDVSILGVHPVEPSDALFEETLESQWGSDLTGDALRQARAEVKAHFDSLYLIEVQVHPPTARFEWAAFTQRQPDQPRENWQVPYDEQAIAKAEGRWAFFFHFLDRSKPLETPAGARVLPLATARPSHLDDLVYELP